LDGRSRPSVPGCSFLTRSFPRVEFFGVSEVQPATNTRRPFMPGPLALTDSPSPQVCAVIVIAMLAMIILSGGHHAAHRPCPRPANCLVNQNLLRTAIPSAFCSSSSPSRSSRVVFCPARDCTSRGALSGGPLPSSSASCGLAPRFRTWVSSAIPTSAQPWAFPAPALGRSVPLESMSFLSHPAFLQSCSCTYGSGEFWLAAYNVPDIPAKPGRVRAFCIFIRPR